MSIPSEFSNVTAVTKGNVYFDGAVTSHAIILADGTKKTLGIIAPGSYQFDTQAPERMEITAGACCYLLKGSKDWLTAKAGETFEIPGDSAFEIAVEEGFAQYICSFLSA